MPGMQVDRYKTHDIEIVVDRIKIEAAKRERIASSLAVAFKLSDNFVQIYDVDTDEVQPYSNQLMCPDTGISYEEPSPNTFSFNSPYGSCPHCNGLGQLNEVDLEKVIPDDTVTINKGGIVPLGEARENTRRKKERYQIITITSSKMA